jgi:hypothetical protein
MAHHRADIHDNARGGEEERRPGRVGDGRDQDVAGIENVRVRGIMNSRMRLMALPNRRASPDVS